MKELQDTQGSEYFKFLSRKAHEGASNQAKVDVANARMIGETGEAEKRGETRQKISKIDAQTAILETQRKSEKAYADAELTNTQTKLNMQINLNNIEASRQEEAKDAELQREVEIKRAEMELEKRRATEVVHAKIERESAQQEADAKLYTDTKGADGLLYKQRQDAEAGFYTDTKGADGLLYKEKQEVEASYFRTTKEAEAAFFAKKKEAEGMTAMAEACGHMADVLGGPSGYVDPSPLLIKPPLTSADSCNISCSKPTRTKDSPKPMPLQSMASNRRSLYGTRVKAHLTIPLRLFATFCKACRHCYRQSMNKLALHHQAGWRRCPPPTNHQAQAMHRHRTTSRRPTEHMSTAMAMHQSE